MRILWIDAKLDDHSQVRHLLVGHEIVGAADSRAWDMHLAAGNFDLIILCCDFQKMDNAAVVGRIRERMPTVPIIVLSDIGDSEATVQVLHQDASDAVPPTRERLRRLLAIVHAAVARVQAVRAAGEAEARFRQLAENAPDIIFRWSYAHGYEYVSPAATAVIGYTPEEHYADPGLGYRAVHPDDLPIYEGALSDIADPKGPRHLCVVRWRHKAGHFVYIEMHMTPIFDERDQLIAIEGISRDISEHILAKRRLRELSSRVIKVGEEERRRIARELHDEIGQALTAIKMSLVAMERAFPKEETERVQERMAYLTALIDRTMTSVRALSRELRPPLLDEVGLEPALAWLCDSFSKYSGLPIHYSSGGGLPPGLSHDVDLAIYRIVQEALTNAARHAHSSKVSVRIFLESENMLTAIVEDSGCGFDVGAVRQSNVPDQGLGILGMYERADLAGGKLAIISSPGKGTRVCVRFPLKDAPQ